MSVIFCVTTVKIASTTLTILSYHPTSHNCQTTAGQHTHACNYYVLVFCVSSCFITPVNIHHLPCSRQNSASNAHQNWECFGSLGSRCCIAASKYNRWSCRSSSSIRCPYRDTPSKLFIAPPWIHRPPLQVQQQHDICNWNWMHCRSLCFLHITRIHSHMSNASIDPSNCVYCPHLQVSNYRESFTSQLFIASIWINRPLLQLSKQLNTCTSKLQELLVPWLAAPQVTYCIHHCTSNAVASILCTVLFPCLYVLASCCMCQLIKTYSPQNNYSSCLLELSSPSLAVVQTETCAHPSR